MMIIITVLSLFTMTDKLTRSLIRFHGNALNTEARLDNRSWNAKGEGAAGGRPWLDNDWRGKCQEWVKKNFGSKKVWSAKSISSLYAAVGFTGRCTMSLDKAKLCDSLLTWVSLVLARFPSKANRRLTGDSRWWQSQKNNVALVSGGLT